MFNKLFLEHPRSVNESYLQHFRMALGFSMKLFSAAIACLMHAIIPGICAKTGSKLISELHEQMVRLRVKKPAGTHNTEHNGDAIEYMI